MQYFYTNSYLYIHNGFELEFLLFNLGTYHAVKQIKCVWPELWDSAHSKGIQTTPCNLCASEFNVLIMKNFFQLSTKLNYKEFIWLKTLSMDIVLLPDKTVKFFISHGVRFYFILSFFDLPISRI